MVSKIALILALFAFLPPSPQAYCQTGPTQAPPSFYQLVGETGWQVFLKNFTVSTEKNGEIFTLRADEARYLSFSAHRKNGEKNESFGPLLTTCSPTLVELLNYALTFGEIEKKGEFSMNVDWELYPESIRGWALVWKDSKLREKWQDIGRQKGYPQLVDMITRQLKKDMQPLGRALGFEPVGASMEKMTFQEVSKLSYFQEILKPAGIPANLKLPMPLILSVRMRAVDDAPVPLSGNFNAVTVDSLFATVQSSSTNIYSTFKRELGEYEISGGRLNPDGTFVYLRPLSQKEYQPIGTQLLKASLRATGADENTSFALRLDPGLYPKLLEEVVKKFTFSPELARKTPAPRPQLPRLQFYTFDPSHASGFASTVNPFLKANGYVFRHLLVSVESGRKAAGYPHYAESFKALAIAPEDHPAVPNIVYLIAGKKPE